MGIVNTFEKCLAGPYLFADAEAPARVPDLIAQAADRLDRAARLRDAPKGDPAEVCRLAYEAMFRTLRALVYRHGYREAGLRCLLLACEALDVRPGRLDPRHLVAFEHAQGLRLDPAAAVAAAGDFLSDARALLDDPGRPLGPI